MLWLMLSKRPIYDILLRCDNIISFFLSFHAGSFNIQFYTAKKNWTREITWENVDIEVETCDHMGDSEQVFSDDDAYESSYLLAHWLFLTVSACL